MWHVGKGNNSIFCVFCEHLVHKGCSGMKGRLRYLNGYKCRKYTGEIRRLEELPSAESVVIMNLWK